VHAWIEQIKRQGIRSIICLLSNQELYDYYLYVNIDLLKLYREAGLEIAHYSITDCLTRRQKAEILPEIGKFYQRAPKACLVHCNAGINRTGTVIKYLLRYHAHPSPS
jgi:protein-tyrosine phosphatase